MKLICIILAGDAIQLGNSIIAKIINKADICMHKGTSSHTLHVLVVHLDDAVTYHVLIKTIPALTLSPGVDSYVCLIISVICFSPLVPHICLKATKNQLMEL